MDGVLVIDKPAGITSHDVVAFARRALGEKRIGHTGTLDPLATGVLPLACGRATRLVQFLTASDKEYEATIRLGVTTDTYDVTGREMTRAAVAVTREQIDAALDTLRGEYLQLPPPYSAKKVGGKRAYALARDEKPVELTPAPVVVRRLDLLSVDSTLISVRLTSSAGFYVRSFAHMFGERLGTGACLEQLRRTRSGDFGLDASVTLEMLQRRPDEAGGRQVTMGRLLPRFPGVTVTAEGLERVSHGREVGSLHVVGAIPETSADWVRLMSADGTLLALARPLGAGGSLHPAVVLI